MKKSNRAHNLKSLFILCLVFPFLLGYQNKQNKSFISYGMIYSCPYDSDIRVTKEMLLAYKGVDENICSKQIIENKSELSRLLNILTELSDSDTLPFHPIPANVLLEFYDDGNQLKYDVFFSKFGDANFRGRNYDLYGSDALCIVKDFLVEKGCAIPFHDSIVKWDYQLGMPDSVWSYPKCEIHTWEGNIRGFPSGFGTVRD